MSCCVSVFCVDEWSCSRDFAACFKHTVINAKSLDLLAQPVCCHNITTSYDPKQSQQLHELAMYNYSTSTLIQPVSTN